MGWMLLGHHELTPWKPKCCHLLLTLSLCTKMSSGFFFCFCLSWHQVAAPLFTFLAAQSNSQTSPALHLLSETSDGRCIDEICLCCTAVRLVFLSVVVVVHRFGQCFGQMLCKRIYGIKSVFTDLPNSQHAWKAELKWGVSTHRYVK